MPKQAIARKKFLLPNPLLTAEKINLALKKHLLKMNIKI
jgi:hypothetical protein